MPTPIRCHVPIELSPEDAPVAAVLHRMGKFYVFLRQVRAELFDDGFQAELAAVYGAAGHRTVARSHRDAGQTDRPLGWQALRAALDSSPLVGRGRVEDTWNLLGRALRIVGV